MIPRFRHQKAAVLLAYLALSESAGPQRPRAHTREELVELLWPEIDPELGRGKLRFMLHSLRQQLELPDAAGVPRLLIAERSTVRLEPGAFTTDAAEFQSAVQAAPRTEASCERAQLLACAVALYRGELLPGFFEPWVLTERQHLAEQYLGALHQLAGALEQVGDLEGALKYAQQAVSVDPLREESHYELMRLYAVAGQPSATLQQYQELERLLRDEVGETPSAASRALAEELRQSARSVMVARSAPRAAPPPPPPAPVPAAPAARPATAVRLPAQFTRFFGREEEIARVTEALRIPETRLVTLTGPGGSGKTRLAIAVAGRLQGEFAGSLWFVPLAEVTEARQIPDAIVGALDLPRSGQVDPLEQAIRALQAVESATKGADSRWALLVLDNFEQLVEEGALVVRTLLERVPRLTCLVTSRQRLELAGEQEFVVLPLPTPPPRGKERTSSPAELLRYPSMQLFVDRAQAARPGFQLTPENAPAVAALCDRLEGLPLAIELAAAWAGTLTPAQMLSRLESTLPSGRARFALLVSRRRDVSARHRTLWAALEWSYQLLSLELQRCLACLSVFRGGWTLEAAEAVCAEPQVLTCLQALRERSLVVAEEAGGSMRYRLLETVREFAAEQLTPEERAALGRRHAEHFLALANEAFSAMCRSEGDAWVERLEREHDNLRAALTWSESPGGDPELAVALGGALGWFWNARGYLTEGRQRLERLVALAGPIPQGLQSSVLRHDPRFTRGRLRTFAGSLAFSQGDWETARRHFQESLTLFQQVEDWGLIAWAVSHLGAAAQAEGDLAAARSFFEEALGIQRRYGTQTGVALALGNLGWVTLCEGDLEAARALFEEGYALFAGLRDKQGMAWGLHARATVARHSGDLTTARRLEEQSLSLRRELGHRPGIAACLAGFAALVQAERQPERAARLLAAEEAICRTIAYRLPGHEQAAYEGEVAAVREALGEERFEAAWREGHALTLEQAVAEALDRSGLPDRR